MKTIAQHLNIKEFPFMINDKQGNEIYYENSLGYWIKREYDKQGTKIYCENIYRKIIDNRKVELTLGKIYYDSDRAWLKKDYDDKGNEIYYEDKDEACIKDNRKVELTLDEIAEKFNINVNQLKIKK